MYAVHFYENNTYILNQALRNIPAVDEEVKLKGRKGKVVSIQELEDHRYFVFVEFEKVKDKQQASAKEFGKKRR